MVSKQPQPDTSQGSLDNAAKATETAVRSGNASSAFSNANNARKGMPDSEVEGVQQCPQQNLNRLTVPEIDRLLEINGNRQTEVESERLRLLEEKGTKEAYIGNLQGFSGSDRWGDGPSREARIAAARQTQKEISGRIWGLDEEMHGLKSQRFVLEEAKQAKIREAELARRVAEKASQAKHLAEVERKERRRKGFAEEAQFAENQSEGSTIHYNVPGLEPRPRRF